MVVTVTVAGLYQAHPARRLPRAGARRQGPRRHGDQGRGRRHQPVRHLHPHARPVLLEPRPGLSHEGLAPARGRAGDARAADGQPAAAPARARRSPPCCRCPRTRASGASCTSCSRPRTDRCGATAWTPSPTCRPRARSRCGSRDEDADDRLIGVALLTEATTCCSRPGSGRAIRFAADRRARVPEPQLDRRARRHAARRRRGDLAVGPARRRGEPRGARGLSPQPRRGRRMSAAADAAAGPLAEYLRGGEEFILTVCANGYGKRSSAYEYRRTGRGGQGITNIDNLARNGPVVASFPAHQGDQLMLVTDQAKLIRMPLGDTARDRPQLGGRAAVRRRDGRACRLRRADRRGGRARECGRGAGRRGAGPRPRRRTTTARRSATMPPKDRRTAR